MADVNAKPEQGVSPEAAVENQRTPRVSLVEGMRKFIRIMTEMVGGKRATNEWLHRVESTKTPEGVQDSKTEALRRAGGEANKIAPIYKQEDYAEAA